MRESKQKCGYFTVIAGNLEGLHHTAKYALEFSTRSIMGATALTFFNFVL
jgi:hypothetical protein